jgi:hypothetical protein
MWIDEAWHDHPPSGVDLIRGCVGGLQLCAGSDGQNGAALDRDCAVFDDSELAKLFSPLRIARKRKQLAG